MYLEQRAEEDTLFAKNYRNPAKNIDDCVTYILNYVQKPIRLKLLIHPYAPPLTRTFCQR